MYDELFAIAEKLDATCDKCDEVCCINMALTIEREDIKQMAKALDMDAYDFRKKYTMLMKNFLKKEGAEWKAMSAEGAAILEQNPRLLLFNEISFDEMNLSNDQKERLIELKKDKEKEIKNDEKKLNQQLSVCPFFDIKKHRCNVHKARPDSCRIFPFNASGNSIDLRKINACEISTTILERFVEFGKKMGKEKEMEHIKETLKNKKYLNHYYLPQLVFCTYIVWECMQQKIPITSEDIKKTQYLMAISGMIKKKEGDKK